MIKKISIIVTLIVFSTQGFASDGTDDFLKKSVQEVTDLVSEHKERFEEDEDFLRSKMNSVVMPKLDITLMSKIILGKNIWTGMTLQQRNDFVQAFKYRMTSTYMKSITAFDGEKIEFSPYIPGKKKRIALVKSKYLIAAGNIDVDYRLIKNDDGWNEVLSKVSEAHPESPLASKHIRKSAKEVATASAVNKWRKKAGLQER